MTSLACASLQIFTNTRSSSARYPVNPNNCSFKAIPRDTPHFFYSLTPQSPDFPTNVHALSLRPHDALYAAGHCWPDACQHCFQTSTDRRNQTSHLQNSILKAAEHSAT
jgi:hypothetical protein